MLVYANWRENDWVGVFFFFFLFCFVFFFVLFCFVCFFASNEAYRVSDYTIRENNGQKSASESGKMRGKQMLGLGNPLGHLSVNSNTEEF